MSPLGQRPLWLVRRPRRRSGLSASAAGAELSKEAVRLFEMQLWCWGLDIRAARDNLLLTYGLERQRPPSDECGSSFYRGRFDDLDVGLWGFGVVVALPTEGSLFVRRYHSPVRCSCSCELPDGVHSPDDIRGFKSPRASADLQRAHRLLHRLFAWIADYERWVRESLGKGYRTQCVTKWSRYRGEESTTIPEQWEALTCVSG
ncbi:hypothetical protein Pan216_51880 [Planctomycetes bacterium Pan216]|uniref:Uncharacterized protein n=1 Tax=Kolteria novifilia TaxID=2527975 RepID=A0A518BBF8_9BACT|nr:hypothetical protein Pan216_51880 [Planctomycetes bacterium Pan216]